MIRKWLPHPLLTLVLTVVWLMLVNGVSLGSLVFGLFLGVVIPRLTASYWPDRPKLRNPLMIAEYIGIVIWDIIRANIGVARLVLFRRNRDLHSGWVSVPLDLRVPEAITVLAGSVTMTPGTVSADLSADGRALLVHYLHSDDPEGIVTEIKERYERRLQEIFE